MAQLSDGSKVGTFIIQNTNNGTVRPSSPVIGQQYFDTTLGKPIWYNPVNEVLSIQITAAATADGNVTVTLDGNATNITVDDGMAEVASLDLSGTVTTAGNVTVTLDGVSTNIAVALNDTAAMVADKIRATVFTGWTTGGTSGTANVTFTSDTNGVKTDATYSVGTSAGVTGIMTTTTQGVNADTAIEIADRIRSTVFTGWTTGGTIGTDTITFTSDTYGDKVDGLYSEGITGATGTATTTTQGTFWVDAVGNDA
ncbi:hypothetical protein [Aquibacillus saliphilus]|uniref:hypothetical protein n=1 Tax=Aquibacillus saliphilus TaxID=1909422 RepID=UPI001CF094AA|nr:hypothetical protein [Aquibacillus saliphilus]